MSKRIAVTVILSGILVLAAYGGGLLGGRRSVPAAIYDAGTDGKAWLREHSRQQVKAEYEATETQVAAQLAALKAGVARCEAAGDTAGAAKRGARVAALEGRLKEVRERKRAHLLELSKEQRAYEELKQLAHDEEWVRREVAGLKRLAELDADVARLKQQELDETLAAVVNAFLDAVESNNVAEVRAMTASELQPRMTKEKVRALARTAPEGGMTFRFAAPGTFEVMFGDKPAAKAVLVLRNGEWVVAQVW